ncbi:MAG: prepilin peptidase [Pseudomonadota bacterium]
MTMEAGDAVILFALLLLPALYTAWSDLKTMTIPNWVSLLLLTIFLVVGPVLYPLEQMGLQIIVGLGVFAVGFLLNLTGRFGGGDAKFAAALVLFVDPRDLGPFLQILAIMSLAGLVTHRLLGRLPLMQRQTAGWQSWQETAYFPLGFSLAGALIFYLGLVAVTA